MNFQAIIDAIHQAWSFAWPPISFIVISLLIIYFLNPVMALNRFRGVLHHLRTFGANFKEAQEVLEPFGLTKLIPLISAIIFIFILYLINGPYLTICKQIPPHLGFREGVLVESLTTFQEKIQIIRMYPRCVDFNQAYFLAVAKLLPKDYDLYHLDKIAFYERMIGLIKCLIPVTVIFLIYNWKSVLPFWNKVLRFVCVIMTLSLSLYGVIIAHRYHKEMHHKVEINAIRDVLADKPWSSTPDLTSYEKSKFVDHTNERWYIVYFIASERIEWFTTHWHF
ncbi:hypothetical protein BWI93_19215 [Siphonobacter sp. BAB-5385]|uniref:hypothetical protein n=1 Tax=Siphonobacter sp. BAB-5385 TaxID=1864822 RepID=UPI000B9E9EF8|nr:hypothetical protein [Siphonobacter sp. BAB-5385]OZI06611.1 hypothetical protein BWI93_19215 [Siphonobacter sp. BAB-5385]